MRWGIALVAMCLSGVAFAQQGCLPVSLPLGTSGANLCYGPATWQEPTLKGAWLQQNFDFYRAPTAGPAPLIIWAHPSSVTKRLPVDGPGYAALVAPALANGFSFASIEFRHPVTNEHEADSPSNPGVPHRDIARALQFIRANAMALNIDKRNIFLVGGSRGTLSVWTALQDEMADPDSSDPVARESTRVSAVFAMNAQTTYDGREFADLFLVPEDRSAAKAAWQLEHPKYLQFGSALQSVNAGVHPDPPLMLRYDHPFVNRLITLSELDGMVEVHYPDFGLALCAAYLQAFGNSARCTAEGDRRYASTADAYAGYVDFFRKHLRGRIAPVLPALPAPDRSKPGSQQLRAAGARASRTAGIPGIRGRATGDR